MTYSILAGGYDAFTGDVNYTAWADYFEKVFASEGKNVKTIVELACGTGSLAVELCKRGYDVTATDISPEMLCEAMCKMGDLGENRPLLLCQDMREIDLYGTYDAALCCLDSINYLNDTRELSSMLARLKNFIEPGGLFIFDINSMWKFQRIAGRSFVAEAEDSFCVWQVGYDEQERRCGYYMDIFTREGDLWRRDTEEHLEYAFTPEEIEEALLENGFCAVRRYGELNFSDPCPDDDRVFFVAIRSDYTNG